MKPKTLDEFIFDRVLNTYHRINESEVVLEIDPKKPGNALFQLHQRIKDAIESAERICHFNVKDG